MSDNTPKTVIGVRNILRDVESRPADEQVVILHACAETLTNCASEIISERVMANHDGRSGWNWVHVGALIGLSRQAAAKRYQRMVDRRRERLSRGGPA